MTDFPIEKTKQMSGPVLVTGANGFLGRTISATLEERGVRVVRGGRLRVQPQEAGKQWVTYGDIGPETDWHLALQGIERVVHLAGIAHAADTETEASRRLVDRVNVQGTERLARTAAAQGVRRLIFISSALVHGASSGERPITEANPLRPEGAYALSKVAAEGRLQDVAASTGMEVVILRAPMVYGARAGGNFARLVRLVCSGLPLPLGCATAPRSFIGADNLANAVACCLIHRAAAGECLLVCDAEVSSTHDLVQKIAMALGRQVHNLRVPQGLVRAALVAVGRGRDYSRLFHPFALNCGNITARLGWSAPYPLREGIARAMNGRRCSSASESPLHTNKAS
jgi:nucleoside-diphosphate-sugar epimerase